MNFQDDLIVWVIQDFKVVLQHQEQYKNIRIAIFEDGNDISKEFMTDNYLNHSLDLNYHRYGLYERLVFNKTYVKETELYSLLQIMIREYIINNKINLITLDNFHDVLINNGFEFSNPVGCLLYNKNNNQHYLLIDEEMYTYKYLDFPNNVDTLMEISIEKPVKSNEDLFEFLHEIQRYTGRLCTNALM